VYRRIELFDPAHTVLNFQADLCSHAAMVFTIIYRRVNFILNSWLAETGVPVMNSCEFVAQEHPRTFFQKFVQADTWWWRALTRVNDQMKYKKKTPFKVSVIGIWLGRTHCMILVLRMAQNTGKSRRFLPSGEFRHTNPCLQAASENNVCLFWPQMIILGVIACYVNCWAAGPCNCCPHHSVRAMQATNDRENDRYMSNTFYMPFPAVQIHAYSCWEDTTRGGFNCEKSTYPQLFPWVRIKIEKEITLNFNFSSKEKHNKWTAGCEYPYLMYIRWWSLIAWQLLEGILGPGRVF
jgi:hypothetical protein